MERIELHNLQDTEALAKKLATGVTGGLLIALSGPVGAGKTTFSKFFGAALGVVGEMTSPTFTVMAVYELPAVINGVHRLVHIDAYRVDNAAELRAAGAEDFLDDPAAVTLLEWPENVAEILEGKDILFLRFGEENEKRIVEVTH